MIHFSKNTFEQAISGDQLVMADFWADWCGPCMMLGPVIEALAEQYEGRAVIGKVNTDQEQELALTYQVSNIPTVIFFKNGREIHREVGVMPPDAYIRILEQEL